MQTELIPRATVESIVAHRNVALAKYAEVYRALTAAEEKVKEAQVAGRAASPGLNSYNRHTDHDREHFLFSLKVGDEDKFTANARRLTDIDVWSHIIQMTDLESIMDKEAKDELRNSLHHDPPEINVENIYATLERFHRDANMIWQRGLANCFSNLDRRFRSHDGWKIGSRIILDYAFNEHGNWNWNRNHEDTLTDVERVFYQLDERRQPASYCGILQAINQERRGTYQGARQSVIESEFFRLRIFKNGNCHIWFLRDDLVEKANKVLAEYYGEVLADSTEQEDDSDLFRPKTGVAKYFGHFPTPPEVAQQVISAAGLLRKTDEPRLTVLEPSAGAGNIAQLAARYNGHEHISPYGREKYRSFPPLVDCIEIQEHLARQLAGSDLYRRVIHGDFLIHRPNPAGLYDRVVMNPLFDQERDIDHVVYAMEFLKPDGVLVAIMSAGTEFRETKKARAFRDYMSRLNAWWKDLPAGSFSSVGTNVNTRLLWVSKDGHRLSGSPW